MINFREWRAIFTIRTKRNTRRGETRDEKNERVFPDKRDTEPPREILPRARARVSHDASYYVREYINT